MNKVINYNKHYYNDSLKEFEKLNTTTSSIYDLDDYSLLIILDDGKNVTCYDDIPDKESVIFISEDLENEKDLSRRYSYPNLKAIVTQNISVNSKTTSYMFYSCNNLTTISGLDTWNTSHLEDTHGMFKNCYKLTNINSLKDWDLSSVVDTSSMFENCNCLNSLRDLVNWDTCNIEDMTAMFGDCTGLKSLDGLSDWNMQSIKSIDRMFENCMNLSDIDSIMGWNLGENISKDNIFRDCIELDEELCEIFDNQLSKNDFHKRDDDVIPEKTREPVNVKKRIDRDPTEDIIHYEKDEFLDFPSDFDYVIRILSKEYEK